MRSLCYEGSVVVHVKRSQAKREALSSGSGASTRGNSYVLVRPQVGKWDSPLAVVELDEKGRVLLPASLRRKLAARRFEVRFVAGRVELAPLQDVKALKGKYRNRIKTHWAKLEEMAEKLVREGKR